MQNHYKILGLTPDADDAVIKAAYRALCIKYHPDRYDGDKSFATELMKKINHAYEILSNPNKKKEFDEKWGQSGNFSSTEQSEETFNASKEIESDWQFAVEYYPKLERLYNQLQKINIQIAYAFKVLIISEQQFTNAESVADKIEHQFLSKYFGTNENIMYAARRYILEGNREAAKEINKAVNIFGSDINDALVLYKIRKRFPFRNNFSNDENIDWKSVWDKETKKEVLKFICIILILILIFSLFGI